MGREGRVRRASATHGPKMEEFIPYVDTAHDACAAPSCVAVAQLSLVRKRTAAHRPFQNSEMMPKFYE